VVASKRDSKQPLFPLLHDVSGLSGEDEILYLLCLLTTKDEDLPMHEATLADRIRVCRRTAGSSESMKTDISRSTQRFFRQRLFGSKWLHHKNRLYHWEFPIWLKDYIYMQSKFIWGQGLIDYMEKYEIDKPTSEEGED
jgi:hypothetical protein